MAEAHTTVQGGPRNGEEVSSIPLHYMRSGNAFVFTGNLPEDGPATVKAKTFSDALAQLAPYTSTLNTPSGEVLNASGGYDNVRTLPPVGDGNYTLGQLRFRT